MILVVCNFNPVLRKDYQMGVPNPGSYKEILNSDDKKYGGTGVTNGTGESARKARCTASTSTFRVTLPPLSTIYLSVPAARKPKAEKPTTEKAADKPAKTAKKPAAKKAAKPSKGRCPCRRGQDPGSPQTPGPPAQSQNDGVNRLWIYVKNGILPKC